MKKPPHFRIIILFFASILLSTCSLTDKSIAKHYKQTKTITPLEVVIINSFPSLDLKWSLVDEKRVLWAKSMLDKDLVEKIIFTEQNTKSKTSKMAQYALAIGIPKSSFIIQKNRTKTKENVYEAYQTAQKLAYKKIAIVSDPYSTFDLLDFRKRHHITTANIQEIYTHYNNFENNLVLKEFKKTNLFQFMDLGSDFFSSNNNSYENKNFWRVSQKENFANKTSTQFDNGIRFLN